MTKKIPSHAAGAALYLALLAPSIPAIGRMTERAGHLAWLAPILMLVPIAALYFIGATLDCGETGLGRVYERVFGRAAGKLLCILYLAWLLIAAGGAVSGFALRLQSMAYRGNVYTPFAAVMLVLVAVTVRSGARPLAGLSEVFFPVIVVTVAAVCALSLSELRPQNLAPSAGEVVGVLGAQAELAVIPALGIFYMFLPGGREKPAPRFAVLFVATLCAAALTVINAFGPELASRLDAVFFLAAKDISISGVTQRIEPLVLALWTVTDYVLVAFLVLAGDGILETVFEKKRNGLYTAILCAVIFTVAVLPDISGGAVVKIVSVALAYILPSAAIVVRRIKN